MDRGIIRVMDDPVTSAKNVLLIGQSAEEDSQLKSGLINERRVLSFTVECWIIFSETDTLGFIVQCPVCSPIHDNFLWIETVKS